jgi:meso-butanediol dehydrogenase/(S,S)-butanediol dehydrogenase/diacetyl reductase
MELKGKVALVTGGARGIGRGIATALARQGVDVAVADLYRAGATTAGYALSTEAEVAKTVAELRALGVRAMGVPCDVTQWSAVQAAVEAISKELGPIDILCNNAGVIDLATVAECTEAQWDAMLNVNAKGVFLCTKAVLPGMIARGAGGRIVNTASVAGKRGRAGLSAYVASKFAVVGFTQSVALEVAKYNVTVNAVCPGILGTAMWHEVILRKGDRAAKGESFEEVAAREIPLGRPQTPEDIGQAVVYLCAADNVTGIALNVAGGVVMH